MDRSRPEPTAPGATLTGLAGQVLALELVLADGSVVHCSRDEDPELFDAARVSVGALGVITQVTLQAVPSFELRAVESSVPLDQLLAELDSYVDGHDHFEFYWFPHCQATLVKCNDRLTARRIRQTVATLAPSASMTR